MVKRQGLGRLNFKFKRRKTRYSVVMSLVRTKIQFFRLKRKNYRKKACSLKLKIKDMPRLAKIKQ